MDKMFSNSNTVRAMLLLFIGLQAAVTYAEDVEGPSGTTCNDQGGCANQEDGYMYADPATNGYIVCQCNCPIAVGCPTGLKFNETVLACDWEAADLTVDCPTGLVYNAITNQCDYAEGYEFPVDCPDDLVYNATSKQCDYAAGYVPKVNCTSDSTICQGKAEGTLYQIEGVCNQFYKCNFNCAVPQNCPNNLVYNPKIEMCTYPQNYDCPWDYTPPSGPDAGPSGISCESNGRCLGQREGVMMASTRSCQKYSVCQCECEIEMTCNSGLYWDQSKLTCNYPANVTCTL